MISPFAHRRLLPEIMDQPGLSEQQHAQALAGLRRLNGASRTAEQLTQQLVDYAKRSNKTQLTVLDIACGGGDIARRVCRLAAKRDLPLAITGLDISATACQFSQQQTEAAGLADSIHFRQYDVLGDSLPEGFDVSLSTLFLHHLEEAAATDLLRRMAAATPFLLVSDLARSAVGWGVAQLACRTLSRSPVVHYDGPQSVAGAFTVAEIRQLCRDADLADAQVTRCWPWRMMIRWEAS